MAEPDFPALSFPRTTHFGLAPIRPASFSNGASNSMDAWEGEIHAFVSTNLDAARNGRRPVDRAMEGRAIRCLRSMVCRSGSKTSSKPPICQLNKALHCSKGGVQCANSAGVAALREAGAVIVGKTVTTEFAAVDPGPTRNPWDTSRTPGGSSSGSAAAVAAGIVSAALGTQVIGSIIRPASYCGCFGYKPSIGSINRGGSFDYLSQSSAGVLAATLPELWIVAREISARVGGDPGFPGFPGRAMLRPLASQSRSPFCKLQVSLRSTPKRQTLSPSLQEKLTKKGIAIYTRDNTPAATEAESAIADAGTLSRKINAWEFRWPLNTYTRHLGSEG